MTALYIISGIILFFAVILNIPIKAFLSYDGKNFIISVKYAFIRIFPKKPKKEKRKRIKKKAVDDNETSSDHDIKAVEPSEAHDDDDIDDTSEEFFDPDAKKKKGKKESLSEKLDTLKSYIPLVEDCKTPLLKLLKTLKITGLDLNIVAADEDAFHAAMLYGSLNAAVYNLLALMKQAFIVKVKSVNIACRFNYPQTEFKISFAAELTPARIIACALVLLTAYIKFKNNDKKSKGE